MSNSQTGFQGAQDYPNKYGIKAYIFNEKQGKWPTEKDEGIDDINSFCVIRAPLTKTASFATLTLNLPTEDFLSLEEYTRLNKFQSCEVCIHILANQDNTRYHKPEIIDYVGCKQYLILHCEALEDVRHKAPYTMTVLVLVNPVLYYLQITNGFNTILEDITAYDALKRFQGFCDKSFGQGAFQWSEVGADYEQNDWVYEQILTRHETDLMLPTQLIINYKLWHTYGYYFFDDFRFDDKAKADITGWLINLGDLEQFKTKNQYPKGKMTDVGVANKYIGSQNIVDHFNVLFQEKPSIVVKGYDVQFGFKKAGEKKSVPQLNTSTQDGQYSSSRASKAISTAVQTGEINPTEHTFVYAPDLPEYGLDRFKKVQKQLREKIYCVDTYYMHDCHLDFIQFGYRYNQSPFGINDYLWVPINICHMFARDTGRVPMFVHNMQYQMLKYINPDG